MKNLSLKEKYGWFTNTLDKLASILENASDEELEYEIYENLDIDSISVFHESVVNEFVENHLIKSYLKNDIEVLRAILRDLIEKELDVSEIRESDEWKRVMEKANELRINLA